MVRKIKLKLVVVYKISWMNLVLGTLGSRSRSFNWLFIAESGKRYSKNHKLYISYNVRNLGSDFLVTDLMYLLYGPGALVTLQEIGNLRGYV